jgi:hypothetical protein
MISKSGCIYRKYRSQVFWMDAFHKETRLLRYVA